MKLALGLVFALLCAGEGVKKIIVVSDEPDKYPAGYFASDIPIHHRDELDTWDLPHDSRVIGSHDARTHDGDPHKIAHPPSTCLTALTICSRSDADK